MALLTRLLDDSDCASWDEYVLAHPDGSPFHLIAWKRSIEETFRFQSLYVVATDDGRIRGVLPLFLVDNFLMGRALISSPFAVYGGALADSDRVRRAIREKTEDLARAYHVKHADLRNRNETQYLGLTPISRYVTFTQRIGRDEAQILQSIPRKTRYMVRKALQQSFSTRVQTTEFLAFEALYSQNLRKLGTPSFPPAHFEALLRNFRGQVDIREVVFDGRVVAAVLSFYFKDCVLPYYGASDPHYNYLAPNNYMYFDLMRHAGSAGYRTFDFGRSKLGSGSYDFKSNWGMEERSLPYEMLLREGQPAPNFTPANPRYRLPIRIWQNLPLPVTRALGPALVRLVP